MSLPRLGYYRYLDGRTVVLGLHPALVGHVATRWLPESVRLSKQQMNALLHARQRAADEAQVAVSGDPRARPNPRAAPRLRTH